MMLLLILLLFLSQACSANTSDRRRVLCSMSVGVRHIDYVYDLVSILEGSKLILEVVELILSCLDDLKEN